ncbi:TauD/TfdA family dioxygenase [Actinomadura rugatobispora]|uniref:TauD/TfdA family dioxygenase n=1 Tax=Actinomadura rugatobispora TaxID=1994 RepID=A0ABW1A239_9ACTN|nr:TauD/TfdA family dioxygenase [Actinomadura rugatobispora]
MRICTRRITGPSAWVGADFQPSDWVVTLEPAERDELLQALRGLPADRPPAQVTAADFPLPRLAPKLAELVRELEFGRGFAVLRGVPIDLPPAEQYLLYWGIVAHMGTAVTQNARGELISHVTDYGKGDLSDNAVRIYETSAVVPFHTDSSDITGLLCLRDAREGGASVLASSTTIHNRLLEEHRELLGVYYVGFVYDRRTEEESGEAPYYRNPVYGYFGDVLSCRYYIRHYIESAVRKSRIPLTDMERLALDLFEEIAHTERNQVSMELRPGDLQFVNNNVVVHSRTAFRDSPGHRRDLLRIWFNTPHARKMPEGFARFRFGMPLIAENE